MSDRTGTLVAIGVGNVLLGDDGAGVRVIEALRRLVEAEPDALPPATRLVDGGTLGLGLLDQLDGACGLLVVDAVDLGVMPGAVAVWRDTAPQAAQSAHGVNELLSVARLAGALPAAVTMVGIGLGEIRPGVALSPRVATAVSRAVDTVRRELRLLDERATGAGAPPSGRIGVPAGARP